MLGTPGRNCSLGIAGELQQEPAYQGSTIRSLALPSSASAQLSSE